MNHAAIYATHPNVVTIDDSAGAFDAQGNKVEIDMAAVNVEVERLTALEPIKARITELKRLLADSDFRVLPDYDKDSEEIKAQRQAWREEVRQLENQ
jgi:hypothetical protein